MTDADWVVADSIYGQLVVNRHDFRGQEILRTGIPPGNASIELLCEALQRRAARTGRRPVVIDVGANCGSYALAFAQHAERVTAIEPQHDLWQALCRTSYLSEEKGLRITPLACAVGLGGRFFTVPAMDRSTYHVSDLVKLEPGVATTSYTERVPELSVDEIVDRQHVGHVDLLKIDTEGMEVDVMEGARSTIAKHKPILFVEFKHCDRFTLQEMLFDLGYPSVQVVEDNDFLCDPDVPFDAHHSYARTDLPSLQSPDALYTMVRLAAETPAGQFVEIGAYKGGSVQRLYRGAQIQGRTLWAFDTFTGVPRIHALDQGIVEDWYAGGDEAARQLMKTFPGMRIMVGEFPRDLVDMGKAYGWEGPRAVAFAHIDCGTYQSTKESMETLWPRMVSGGVMLMGDYGYQGSKLAADTTAFQLVPKPKTTLTEERRLVLTKP